MNMKLHLILCQEDGKREYYMESGWFWIVQADLAPPAWGLSLSLLLQKEWTPAIQASSAHSVSRLARGCLNFPGGTAVKNLPAMQELQETQVPSLGWEGPLKEGIATHSIILAWRIPWTEEPGCSPQGHKESDTTEVTEYTHTHCWFLLGEEPEPLHLLLWGLGRLWRKPPFRVDLSPCCGLWLSS